MSRKNTGVWKAIQSMCEMQKINEDALYQKSKMLLTIYRRVCWSTIGRADAVAEEICYYCGSDLDGALLYLETFALDEQRNRFEERIKTLFDSRWMMEMVEGAMVRVKEFPDGGELFFDILNKAYLWKNKYTESEMLEILNIERSRFYDRKKEAIMVFGLALWGAELPKVKGFLKETDEVMEVECTT
ncbi:hypothetical protein [Faecalimonas sp.]